VYSEYVELAERMIELWQRAMVDFGCFRSTQFDTFEWEQRHYYPQANYFGRLPKELAHMIKEFWLSAIRFCCRCCGPIEPMLGDLSDYCMGCVRTVYWNVELKFVCKYIQSCPQCKRPGQELAWSGDMDNRLVRVPHGCIQCFCDIWYYESDDESSKSNK
jgi:hypothetical protein